MSTLRTNALEGVDAKNSITIVAGAGNITTTNVQEGLCKAWVNFDGTASGAASRDSFNVSGMADNGTGNYTITINSDMSNVNYSCSDSVGDHNDTSESIAFGYTHTQATGSVGILSAHYDGGANSDRSNVSVQICGDLA